MSALKKPTIILVDGSSYLYRAFHALPALANSKGFPTGAVYGMINMLKRLINDYQPEYMAVIFDAKGKTFRDEIYAEYKATRNAMPDDLTLQIEPIHKIIRALGLPLIVIEGVEADDVIGTLAQHASLQGKSTLISTGDKDLAQLVNDQVTLINTMTNTFLDPAGVKEKFGIPPDRVIDYLTLVGDTSDNIPGVEKVGPKTAAKWLQEYETLEKIIANADKISGKVGENLRAALNNLPLTRTLVTIKLDVSLPLDFLDLKINPADKKLLIELYKDMEFKTWLAELLEEAKEANVSQYKKYSSITNEKDFNSLVKTLSATDQFALITETANINHHGQQLIGIGVATKEGEAAYIPLSHTALSAPQQLEKKFVLEKLKSILENPNICKISHNIKQIIEALADENISVVNIKDTMMESYILDSSNNAHDLISLALKYLGWRVTSYEEIAGKGMKEIPFAEVALENATIYVAEKADVVLRLHAMLWPKIEADKALNRVFSEIELPLIPVLACMEMTGVLIDPIMLQQQGKELEKRLKELEQEIYQLAGCEFNIHSPKQLQEILFTKLKLPILQKTPTGQASTADAVLQELALEFTIANRIIECRSLSKLISTYTSRLVEQINPRSKRIHTSYNQAGTATGRLSSSDPNLQNIPIRTTEGRRIRKAFIAPKGYKIISADYSQIELRLMAHISEDPSLVNAFMQNLDIHRATAAEVGNVPIEKVTSDMRRNAKAVNFGLIYGMSAFGLTRQLGIDRKEAQEYIDKYFARYPKVKAYMDDTRAHAKEKGYVQTLWGRRLYLPDIKASQIPRQKAAERAAINAPLQGSAADIIKLAMVRVNNWLLTDNIPARMIMQVHDELVFEAKEDSVQEIAEAIRQHMSEVAKLKIPLLVSVGIGENWDEASDH